MFSQTRRVSDVVIEAPSMNSRRITASVVLDCPIDAVWDILTDYNNLATHVPNLVKSYTLPNPSNSKGIRLFQEGAQKIIGFDFRASLTMDMTEEEGDENNSRREKFLYFKLAESMMFASFDGSWTLKYHSRTKKLDPVTGQYNYAYKTLLTYSVFVRPKGLVPVIALEWRIREDVPVNLLAVKSAAEGLHSRRVLTSSTGSSTSTIWPQQTQTSVSVSTTVSASGTNSVSTSKETLDAADIAPLPTSIAKRVYQSMWDEDETLGMYIGGANSYDTPSPSPSTSTSGGNTGGGAAKDNRKDGSKMMAGERLSAPSSYSETSMVSRLFQNMLSSNNGSPSTATNNRNNSGSSANSSTFSGSSRSTSSGTSSGMNTRNISNRNKSVGI